jgi:catechol 2,3-dioxygenase-like lactoylglutathione lyase family enzyme
MFITVRSVARSRDFYSRVLGGTVVLQENPCIVKLSNSWILMNPGGPPTPDKPGISVVNYEPGDTTSIFLNLRVADIQACYEEWKSRGAEFVTPPVDREAEIRCYLRDPDGYMIEAGQATGVLHGQLAKKRVNGPLIALELVPADPVDQLESRVDATRNGSQGDQQAPLGRSEPCLFPTDRHRPL